MDLTIFKFLSAAFIFGVGLVGSILSRRLLDSNADRPAIGIANTFAGGVFLAAGLIHVLPDAQGDLASALPEMDYPLFGLLACGALVVMVFIDQLGHQLKEQSNLGQAGAAEAPVSAAVLFLILSIHSLITGISLGIETQNVAALALLIAVLAHKGTAAFALGLKVRAVVKDSGKYFRQMTAFSLTTPAGILLGLYLVSKLSGAHSALYEGIFDAVAAGTFLYVAIFEILAEEFQTTHQLVSKTIALVAGVTLMAVVAIWT